METVDTADSSVVPLSRVNTSLASRQPGLARGWLLYLLFGLGALELYYVLPAVAQNWAYEGIGCAGFAAVVTGIVLHRPERRLQWSLIAFGLATETVGDLAFSAFGDTGVTGAASDTCYLIGPLVMAVGLAGLTYDRQPRLLSPALLDGMLLAAAIGIIGWPTVVAPNLDMSAGWPEALVACLQPFLDLVLLAVLGRHLFSGARRSVSLGLLGLGFVCWLISDFWFVGTSIAGTYEPGSLFDAGWLLGFLLIGAAALHPSMPHLLAARDVDELSPVRFGMITASLAVPVVVLALEPIKGPADAAVAVAGSTILVAIIVARLYGSLTRSRTLLLESHALQAQLVIEAATDPLTGLPNRRTLLEHAATALDTGNLTALLFVDLDAFKQVNDTWGHEVGDTLLVDVAHRMAEAVPQGAMIGRLGGDEFGIVLPSAASLGQVQAVAEEILATLVPEFAIYGNRQRVRASMGIALRSGGDVSALAREADIAMYEAKRAGGDRIEVHRPAHNDVVIGFRLAGDLERALDRGDLRLWYQPIFDLAHGHLAGAEALVRWEHPERGLLAPSEFLPHAELTRLMPAIDSWVIRRAADDIGRWRANGLWRSGLGLHVNVSPHSFSDLRLVDALADAIEACDLLPRDVVVELTESAQLSSPTIATTLRSLHDFGVRLALDDLGTRYAVLAALAALPFDIVKLDRSLLPTSADPGAIRLFEGVLRLVEGMDLEPVAEGIETPAQLELARKLGCRFGQGYLLGRPEPAELFAPPTHWVAAARPVAMQRRRRAAGE